MEWSFAATTVPKPGTKPPLGGFIAWLGWLFIHIAFLTTYRNRAGAILTWWLAFTRDLRRERSFTAHAVGRVRDIYLPEPAPGSLPAGASVPGPRQGSRPAGAATRPPAAASPSPAAGRSDPQPGPRTGRLPPDQRLPARPAGHAWPAAKQASSPVPLVGKFFIPNGFTARPQFKSAAITSATCR